MIEIKKRIGLEQFINREYPPLRSSINSSGNVDENGCPVPPFDVNIDEYVSNNPKYGQIDKSFIVFPIFFQQTIDNIGLYTDFEYEEALNLINTSPDPYTRLTALPVENYYTEGSYTVSGFTESVLDLVTSYNINNPFIVGLNLDNLPSQGFTGVLEIKEDSIVYVIGGDVDSVGKYVDGTGILMETFSSLRNVVDPQTNEVKQIPLTTFQYKIKGFQEYNTSLSAIVHEDKYLGVVESPRVDNDVLIDRGSVNVMEKHLKMSEIDSVEQLERYGQGFFNVTTSQ